MSSSRTTTTRTTCRSWASVRCSIMVSSVLEFNEKLRNFEELKVYFQFPSKSLEITLKTWRAQLYARCSDDDDDDKDFERRRCGLLEPPTKYDFLEDI